MSTKRKICIVFSWLVVAVITMMIYKLSAQNAEESKELSDSLVSKILQWIQVYIDGELIRKFAHMLEFTALSFFLANSIYVTLKTKSATIIAFAITVLCAVGDEIHQIFVPGRAFQTTDILVDSAGALIGAILYFALVKLIFNIKERGKENGNIKTI